MLFLCYDSIADVCRRVTNFREFLKLSADQIYYLGNQSISLVLTAGIATGAVMALQFGNSLQRFGGSLYIPEIVGLSVFRELGPVLISLLLAGRVGSGMTSELASMNITEQVDAIRALGESPFSSLVAPRILACLLVFPILTLLGDAVSTLSAMLITWSEFSIGPFFFLSKVFRALTMGDLWTGVLKTVVFGFYVAVAACWKGLRTTEGTRGVGDATTWIVVHASIFIMLSDFFMSKFFILTVLSNEL
jgi:phospholipid/cholesterol/gamma-HCH transport system permease protein